MKHIHFPTLVLHAGLMLLAGLTMNDYADAFLVLGGIALICHIFWCGISRQLLFPAHLLGSVLQFTAHGCGLISVDSGAFGLGGGGFAQFFYLIALGLSLGIEAVITLIRRDR